MLTRIEPEKVNVHENAVLRLSRKAHFFQIPAILVRYKLLLSTKDDKTITHIFDGFFFKNNAAEFPALRRGAYYGPYDYLVIQDIFGFFCRSLRLPQVKSERLLAQPFPPETAAPPRYPPGGLERRGETVMRKTDDFTEQRPYIPGDDPRRINWKLFSHAGELFVRQEEREPPPHSHLILLMDTEADDDLYSAEEGAAAVDAMCDAAFAALADISSSGGTFMFGFTGSDEVKSGAPADIPALLAYPARVTQGLGARLPDIPDISGGGILIMALARGIGKENTALQKFFAKGRSASIRIVFFYGNEKQKNMAESCAILYNRVAGVYAFVNKFC